MLKLALAVAIGSAFGGLFRWGLSIKFNQISHALFGFVPLGTLLSNLIAGYIIGFALGYFSQVTHISQEWRLLIMTGFCGGLSTFSTFSIEVFALLQKGAIGWASSVILVHVIGSVLLTFIGFISYQWLKTGF